MDVYIFKIIYCDIYINIYTVVLFAPQDFSDQAFAAEVGKKTSSYTLEDSTWNLQPSPIWKGKWSETNLHDYGPC